ncbi:MAG: FAD-binding protein [Prevotella sp.]|nr:FAD-binding protein [Prevotella sp.]
MGIISILHKTGIAFEQNIPLSKKTWIKTGGICGCWITPTSVGQLTEVCKYLQSNGIKFDIVGQTSNIFFHSTYNPEVVVSTVRVNNYSIEGNIITCDCGANVMKLAKDCLSQGYAGFYGLVGLPGTVAAAAVNNAGCFHCSISSMLVSADVLNPDGSVETISKDDFHYTRRSSVFKRGERTGIVLSVKLKIEKAADIDVEIRKSDATKAYRKNRQEGPKLNLGSVFSTLKARRNVKNITAFLLSKIAGACHLGNEKRIHKQVLLSIYGYTDLSNYISDKQMNTFVWRDGEAEEMFVRYKEFMGKVFKSLTIEIEEKQ